MFKILCNRRGDKINLLKIFLYTIVYSSLMPTCLLKTKVVHGKHFVIHVPMKIRTHHHTHTVYTQVHGVGKDSSSGSGGSGGSGGGGKTSKQTIYKIMGYSTHHMGVAAGSGGSGGGAKFRHHRHYGHIHGYRPHRGDSGNYGEIDYDDYLNCDESLPQAGGGGDMIFNHFSRHDQEDYPDVEEVIDDDELGDEWE